MESMQKESIWSPESLRLEEGGEGDGKGGRAGVCVGVAHFCRHGSTLSWDGMREVEKCNKVPAPPQNPSRPTFLLIASRPRGAVGRASASCHSLSQPGESRGLMLSSSTPTHTNVEGEGV
ncbi:hypothetical protein AMECASPLE_004790 [Ameca splendens]|uniref:Uncharacterized protein n=1 Tax=Ameca splendens TaxID=208324 RepID=A0ABV0XN22_9TELE